jgi:hypothetical protein
MATAGVADKGSLPLIAEGLCAVQVAPYDFLVADEALPEQALAA